MNSHKVTPQERLNSRLRKREIAEKRGAKDADKFAAEFSEERILRQEWMDTLRALSTMQDFIERGYFHGYCRAIFEHYQDAKNRK